MKNASKILTIIACVLGILWSIIGAAVVFFGSAAVAGLSEAGGDRSHTAQLQHTAVNTTLALIGALIVIIVGMVFSAVGNAETASRAKTLTMGILLLLCGILATAWHSFVAGPIYAFSGLLTILAGAFGPAQNRSN
jgi:hypothetical protein